ncbi:MAG: hypothetical protein ABW185_00440 [Sedimenticola sp.]
MKLKAEAFKYNIQREGRGDGVIPRLIGCVSYRVDDRWAQIGGSSS